MAIVKCRECSDSVSDTASSCPHCGAKRIPKTTRTTSLVAAFIMITISSLIIFNQFELLSYENMNKSVSPIVEKQEYNSDKKYSIKDVASYIGKFNVDIASDYDVFIDESGNITVDDSEYKTFFQVTDNRISYIQVDFKKIVPCQFNRTFQPNSYLSALGYDENMFVKNKVGSNFVLYTDNVNRFSVNVGCMDKELPLIVVFRKMLAT
ncbi:hypothetical protein [Shewanella algae]|uniref:hypothetical protein n=1 Tax=Shewanella algae TaxID=38313 RepID=UPI001AADFE04|nr:hypothetical protein [Shewanella algae]MBO2658107.1 hypothetical protein [Shewanella algae]